MQEATSEWPSDELFETGLVATVNIVGRKWMKETQLMTSFMVMTDKEQGIKAWDPMLCCNKYEKNIDTTIILLVLDKEQK